MFKTFRILYFGHLNLSFGYAQDGELAEPFRISDFDIRIFSNSLWGYFLPDGLG